MAKLVVVLTGSPRKGGNSGLLADAFMAGARAAGHDVHHFDAAADPVQPCRDCDACWSQGKACVFSDGFDRLAPLLERADAIAFCSPVYWAALSAQLKAAMDKFHAYVVPHAARKLKPADTFLLMCSASPSPEEFAAPSRAYQDSVKFLGMHDRGQLLVPGVYKKGAIKDTDALARAEQLGRGIA